MKKQLLLSTALLSSFSATTFISVNANADTVNSATTFTIKSKYSHQSGKDKCLGVVDGQWGEVRDCQISNVQRFYIVRVSDGSTHNENNLSGDFTIRPVSGQMDQCLHHVWGSDFKFSSCNGSSNQKYKFNQTSKGYQIIAKTSDSLTKYMSNLLGSGAVSGESNWFNPTRINWDISVDDPNYQYVASNRPGVGGDPTLVNHLTSGELDNLNDASLATIRDYLEYEVDQEVLDDVIIYRGSVKDNLNGTPVAGFEVCTHFSSYPNGGTTNPVLYNGNTITGIGGKRHACARTDSNGVYTLIGLPKDLDVTATLQKAGYLQLAYTMRTSHADAYANGDYTQEYVSTAADTFAVMSYLGDSRYTYSSGYDGNNKGGMAFTIINKVHPVSGEVADGYISEGMYHGNPVSEVTFQLYQDLDGNGEFTDLYKDTEHNNPSGSQSEGDGIPDGLFYTDYMVEDEALQALFGTSEFPKPALVETSENFGLAMMVEVPPGLYEVEAFHPTLDCVVTTDSWTAKTSSAVLSEERRAKRGRFESLEDMMGDVRWICE